MTDAEGMGMGLHGDSMRDDTNLPLLCDEMSLTIRIAKRSPARTRSVGAFVCTMRSRDSGNKSAPFLSLLTARTIACSPFASSGCFQTSTFGGSASATEATVPQTDVAGCARPTGAIERAADKAKKRKKHMVSGPPMCGPFLGGRASPLPRERSAVSLKPNA